MIASATTFTKASESEASIKQTDMSIGLRSWRKYIVSRAVNYRQPIMTRYDFL